MWYSRSNAMNSGGVATASGSGSRRQSADELKALKGLGEADAKKDHREPAL